MPRLKVAPVEQAPEASREFLNERSLQIGHILPLSDRLFKEYFPPEGSFLALQGNKPEALFYYHSGEHKEVPTARFRIVADSTPGLREAVEKIEETALAEEKLVLRTSVLGYDAKKLKGLQQLGFLIGASLPETVSLDGRRYDLHILYKELTGRYNFNVKRAYAGPGLYLSVEVKKAKNPKLKVRGYRREDRAALDKFAGHPNVIRGIASGLFEGLYPWRPGGYQEMVDSGLIYPIVCEDEATREPVGLLDLFKQFQDVMQHSMGLGMYVKPEYQSIGVGTMLIQAMKVLARRLHLTRVWLGVFEGNSAAERLYRKTGFVECGKVPGWLQEGYVNELFMTLKLD